ncbi:4'-phosphopantetheinyl transferase family protein [Paraburkholderia sp. J76]|uniref:4'-phosphopantetheinyl transferase family protein n=1 Tax=Paraburkholderia sp. J76 TaxID=2805439 RepID=UPI002ABDFEF4|nr:4'-phosphopantetheinyl transferase superfamily protein [Paraburkholderia sp. J76]
MRLAEGRLLERHGRWPEDVEVRLIDASASADDLARMQETLDASERQRAGRYRLQADRERFVCTRYALRTVLAGYTGCEPAALRFRQGARGKPFLEDHPGLSFNASHSGGHGLIAVSARRSVGVDIEHVNAGVDWHAIADLVCSAQEQRIIEDARADQRRAHFYRIWTAKEALVKALGLGIGDDLASISVHVAAGSPQRPAVATGSEFAAAAALKYRWIDEVEGHAACVAFGDDNARPAFTSSSSVQESGPARAAETSLLRQPPPSAR